MRRKEAILAVAAAAVTLAVVPLLVVVARRSRPGDYSQSAEFRALVGGYAI